MNVGELEVVTTGYYNKFKRNWFKTEELDVTELPWMRFHLVDKPGI